MMNDGDVLKCNVTSNYTQCTDDFKI